MPADDLRELWKLHLIDEALHEIRSRAAAMDPGRKLMSEITALTQRLNLEAAEAGALAGEQSDIELRQKTIDEKVAKFDKDLYGGKVVNPREVENIQKEIEALKRQRADMDGRLLELWDLVPPAKEKASATEKILNSKKQELQVHQKGLLEEKATLESAYKDFTAKRPEAIKTVPAPMLAKYDAVLKKHGTAMAKITRQRTCEACGLALSEKSIEFTKEGRMVPCDQCHRFLYYTEGIY